MKKRITGLVFLILLLGIAGFAVYRYFEAAGKEESGKNSSKNKAVVVNVVLPERRTLPDDRKYSGTAYAWSSYDVEPKVGGKLLEMKFDIGDKIKRGDLIAVIDDEEYVQQLRQSEANLEYARAKLKEAEAVALNKEREYKRQSSLQNVVALSAVQTAESELAAQNATAEMCRADVKRCEAELDNAKLKLADTRVRAEWREGAEERHIGARYVDAGTLLTAGKPVVGIVELNRIKAYVQIIERDYPRLRPGQKAEVTSDAWPDRTFEGTITNIGNVLSEKTRSALAMISVDNHELLLRPGMFLRVRLLLGTHENAQIVPSDALLRKNDRDAVFCFDNGKAKLVPVKTGLSGEGFVEIVEPELKLPVVTVGNHLLEDGKDVEVSELSRLQIVEKRIREHAASAADAGKTENGK